VGCRDRWFNQARPMVIHKPTWREKRLAKEEGDDCSDSDDSQEKGEGAVTTEAGIVVGQASSVVLDMKMVFEIPAEFRAPKSSVVKLSLGAERAVFEKHEKTSEHTKPLFVKGYLDGKLVGRMMVDEASSWTISEKDSHLITSIILILYIKPSKLIDFINKST
jgi:hypothetical protein